MPIPKTRIELKNQIRSSFEKLQKELDMAGEETGALPCIDGWTVKDLLAVRVWWTEAVISWITSGKQQKSPCTPAKGYRWHETPQLNQDIVKRAKHESYHSIRTRLTTGFTNVNKIIDLLDDRELLEAGIFLWSGKYPLSRWLSINTTRQYTTVCTFIRRAIKARK